MLFKIWQCSDVELLLTQVRENIQQFGGDPGRITLGGQEVLSSAVFPKMKQLSQTFYVDTAHRLSISNQ